jgi:phenylacetate-CoA ligase
MNLYRGFYRLLRLMRPNKALTRHLERELERNQWLSAAEVQAISWHKLQRLLRHAHDHVPFYRARFQEVGLTPDDIDTPAAFRRLPMLTKEEIRQNEDVLIADGYDKSHMKRTVTSGSTGVPFVTYHDREFEAANVAAFARSRGWFGWEFGDKVAWIWGRREEIPQSRVEKLIYYAKQERWMDGFHPTPERITAFAELLRRWQPDLIAGYANVMALLAEHVLNAGMTDIRPKFVEPTGMSLWPRERELIQKAFQCPVSDRYGSHETGSVVVAECPEGSRHVFADLCYLEILADGEPVPPGEPGEVVATPLHAFGMPIIRFRLGDVATRDDRRCPCGRGLPLLDNIEGRITSIFTLPSGRRLYGGAFRHLVLKDATTIRKFRVHQQDRDRILVTLERGEGFSEDVVALIRQRCLKLLEGEPVQLTIAVTDEIPTTTSGKHLVTVSDVPVDLN